ncbi:phasin family protein [Desulfurella sp.]|uniref:phasin family protein n=1 Tax=Desulfurella sp. TaxID=1962857 RepID=UPI0025BE4140|nr:phasin family protein [Desulfurella sp.]
MLKDLFYAGVGLVYNINQKITKAIEDGKSILKEKNVSEYISSEVSKKKEDIDKVISESLNEFFSKIGIATKEDIEKLRQELKNFKHE